MVNPALHNNTNRQIQYETQHQ